MLSSHRWCYLNLLLPWFILVRLGGGKDPCRQIAIRERAARINQSQGGTACLVTARVNRERQMWLWSIESHLLAQ